MFTTSAQKVSLDQSGIYIFESQHAKNFKMKLGMWDFAKICLVRKGNGLIEHESDPIKVKEGDVIFIPENYPHKFVDTSGDPLTLLMVCFSTKLIHLAPVLSNGYEGFKKSVTPLMPLNTLKSHRRTDIYQNFKRMVFEQITKKPGFELKNWGLLFELLVMASRTSNEMYKVKTSKLPIDGRDGFLKTIDYIDENFTNDIQIKNLATYAGISYRYYTFIFKRHKGTTVNAYIKNLRLNFSKKLLLETNNILYSSLDAGFTDLSNFYRIFNSEMGMTPKKYIETYTTE
tara:strand:+ start:1155 stop:2015 length:861 start_codon:yes stop_codon:yes gene_type:complete